VYPNPDQILWAFKILNFKIELGLSTLKQETL
jgi:hypothetical protein